MKKCSYCGAEYPDDATSCAVDGMALLGPTLDRENVTGVWRGVYGNYNGKKQFAFTLRLKQGWLGHFTGSVTEDAPEGTPGTGAIDGYFQTPTIEFTKQMPVGYTTRKDGSRVTLREYLLAEGHKCEKEIPSAPIRYEGTFLDASRVQGTWTINSEQMRLPGGLSFSFPRTSGFWCAEFKGVDLKAEPSGGPTAPLFDKSLLLPAELEEVEAVSLHSVGKLNVADAEKILNQFQQRNIAFELNRDDSAIRLMSPMTSYFGGYYGTANMIEIFVHPEDVAAAEAIINGDNEV
jgi:hypothetical protein